MREIMTIKLIATQVVDFWDLIKYALNQVERIGDVEADGVYNRLFAMLLSDRGQCFVVYGEDKAVNAICITSILHDEIKDSKTLHIRCLYAFRSAHNSEWGQEFNTLREFAKSEGCGKITFETANQKIKAIVKSIGAVEVSTNMVVEV